MRIKVVDYESGSTAFPERGEFFLVDHTHEPMPAPTKEEWNRVRKAAEKLVVKH
jgi:hypothetical protein